VVVFLLAEGPAVGCAAKGEQKLTVGTADYGGKGGVKLRVFVDDDVALFSNAPSAERRD
jgi:hypothetical protein